MIKRKISLVAIVLLCIFASCSSKKDECKNETTNVVSPAFLANVKTVKASIGSQEEDLTLTGKVEYDPDRVINYAPLVGGIVEKTYFSLGDKVQKGQILLDIRSSDLSQLQADYITLEAESEVAGRERQQAQSLYNDKMLSEKELLEAQSKLKQAQASLERVKNDLSMYIHKGNGLFSIKAPMSGYIVHKNAASGSPVSSDGNPLFTIADLSKVWITANVYAGDLQSVQENMPVNISSLSYPNEVFEGKVDALSQVFDPEEKVLKARIVMPNKHLKFKPEMSVIVHLKNKKAVRQVAIPSEALIFDNNAYFVVVADSNNNLKIKQVELSGAHGQTTYIRSGLTENENVVVKNQLLIYEGLLSSTFAQ
ncbi:MAG: efflux RND transporter periplasmic adaptor subunit [Dysgonamonadaceae bacterium]|jgi:cobalt-zinc-cadmium efflux system membrane fusion protein|nr:efflux RND transporter periplasmic adaptor subunit [Dysgonamonadaceae bacterium]